MPKVEELEWIYFSDPTTTIDVVHPVTGRGVYSDRTLEQFREEYPNAEKIHLEEAIQRRENFYRTEPATITQEQFQEALNVLPPVEWTNASDVETFKMSERLTDAITAIYCRIGDNHFSFNDNFTLRHEDIVARCLKVPRASD